MKNIIAWARKNWRTTAVGLLSGMAIVLQRLPDHPRPQDVIAALLMAALGVLATDRVPQVTPASPPSER
jgi:hypothetical protein